MTVQFIEKMTTEAISLIGSMGPKPGPDSCTYHLYEGLRSADADVQAAAKIGLARFRAADQDHLRAGRLARAVEGAMSLRRMVGAPAKLTSLAERADEQQIAAMVAAGVIAIDGDRYDVLIWGDAAVDAASQAVGQ